MLSIPAAQVAAGHLPHICARHGEPPAEMRRIRFISKPPSWAPVLILAGGIVYLIVVSALRKKIEAPAWAWCAQCKAQRSRLLGIGLGVLALGLLLIVIGVVTIQNTAGPLLCLVGLLALLAGAIVAARASYQAISSAFVSQDGQYLEVHKEDQRFVQALRQSPVPAQPAWSYAPQPQPQQLGYGGQPQPQPQQWGYGGPQQPQPAYPPAQPQQPAYGRPPAQPQPWDDGGNPQQPGRY
jgi:hypothetical protein